MQLLSYFAIATAAQAFILPDPRTILPAIPRIIWPTHTSHAPSQDQDQDPIWGTRIPTVHESAIMARRILRLESIGTISTVFPSTRSRWSPPGIENQPIGLMEYFADCEPLTGNPTFLAITIATSFVNAAAGSNVTLSMRWHPREKIRMPPSGLPRFSLMGHVEDISDEDARSQGVEKCFTSYHADAKWWTPGNDIHTSKWMRLVVDQVFFFGGYGDRAFIGWIPLDVWQAVTEAEIDAYRLPGEATRRSWW